MGEQGFTAGRPCRRTSSNPRCVGKQLFCFGRLLNNCRKVKGDVTSNSFWVTLKCDLIFQLLIDQYSFQLGKKLSGTVGLLAKPCVTAIKPPANLTLQAQLQARILNHRFKDLV